MADDNADDVKSEISLDDFNADEQQPAEAEPSPAPKGSEAQKEPAAPEEKAEAKDTEEEKAVKPPDVPTKTETEDQKVEETENEEKPEEKPQTKADERKAQLNTEIRDLVAQKNALQAEVTKANAEVYQVASVDELTEQGMSDIEAKVEAMRQEREMERYNSQVADAQLTLAHESQRVLSDFPIFNPDSEQFDKELSQEASELLSSNLVIDENTNQIIGSNISPYKLYQTLARASGISATKGEIKGQANTEKQLANIDANSSAAPPKQKVDPLMELWKSDD